MAESGELTLEGPDATEALGARLARALRPPGATGLTVYLVGDLGAGKTTLARGFLRAMGHEGRVPSPTYTLVEPYDLAGYRVFHIDLYRIRHAAELQDLGLSDALAGSAVALIEWPDQGANQLPPPDVVVHLCVAAGGRVARCEALTEHGRTLLRGAFKGIQPGLSGA